MAAAGGATMTASDSSAAMTADAGGHDSMASCDNLAYSWPHISHISPLPAPVATAAATNSNDDSSASGAGTSSTGVAAAATRGAPTMILRLAVGGPRRFSAATAMISVATALPTGSTLSSSSVGPPPVCCLMVLASPSMDPE